MFGKPIIAVKMLACDLAKSWKLGFQRHFACKPFQETKGMRKGQRYDHYAKLLP